MDWLPSCESKSLPDSMEDVMDVTRTQDVSKYHQIDRTQSSKRTNERTNGSSIYNYLTISFGLDFVCARLSRHAWQRLRVQFANAFRAVEGETKKVPERSLLERAWSSVPGFELVFVD